MKFFRLHTQKKPFGSPLNMIIPLLNEGRIKCRTFPCSKISILSSISCFTFTAPRGWRRSFTKLKVKLSPRHCLFSFPQEIIINERTISFAVPFIFNQDERSFSGFVRRTKEKEGTKSRTSHTLLCLFISTSISPFKATPANGLPHPPKRRLTLCDCIILFDLQREEMEWLNRELADIHGCCWHAT